VRLPLVRSPPPRHRQGVDNDWQPFFGAMAVVSVVVLAVLLAALHVASGRWRGSPLKEVAAVLAVLALLVPLVGSLVALMPGVSWRVGFLVMGGLGLCALGWQAASYLRREEEADAFDDRQVQWGLPVSLGVYASLVAFSCAAASWAVYVVAGLSVWLVVAGLGGAWVLLARAARPQPAPTVSR
jgi:hypothetical protein